MAQMQFTNYQDDILSFDLRQAMLGILNPGRYCGYDTFSPDTEGGGVISITIRHTATGIRKSSKANPPVAGLQNGVVMTPQGLIIQDDNGAIPITIDDGSGNGGLTRYDVIYLSHIYLDGVPGDNPATYHIVKGTPGSGTPAVPFPAYQVPLIVVTIPDGVTTWTGLTFTPVSCPELGDLDIQTIMGTILGDRLYTENNFIVDAETLTSSIDKLDMQLKDDHDTIISVGARALDDVNWGALSDNIRHNASETAHGLFPKFPGQQEIGMGIHGIYYLDSTAHWVRPVGDWIWLDSDSPQLSTSTGILIPAVANSAINMSLLGLSGVAEILVEMSWVRDGGINANSYGSARLSPNSDIQNYLELCMLCAPYGFPSLPYYQRITGVVPVESDAVYLSYHNISGVVSYWNAVTPTNIFYIRVIAYKRISVSLP